MPGACGGQKEVLVPLGMVLWIIVSPLVGAGN